MFTNEKILSKCHDYKHDSKILKFESRQKKIRVDVKKENASRVRETADQLSCQWMVQRSASMQNGVSLASKYSRFFFLLG